MKSFKHWTSFCPCFNIRQTLVTYITFIMSEWNFTFLRPGGDWPVCGLVFVPKVPLSDNFDLIAFQHLEWLEHVSTRLVDSINAFRSFEENWVATPWLHLTDSSLAPLWPSLSWEPNILRYFRPQVKYVSRAISTAPAVLARVLSRRLVVNL